MGTMADMNATFGIIERNLDPGNLSQEALDIINECIDKCNDDLYLPVLSDDCKIELLQYSTYICETKEINKQAGNITTTIRCEGMHNNIRWGVIFSR